MRKTQLYKIFFLVSFWILATAFIVFFGAATVGFKSTIGHTGYSFSRVLIIGLLVSFVFSIVMATFEVLFFNKLLRKKPLGIALTSKTLFYLLCIFIGTSIVVLINYSGEIEKPIFHTDTFTTYTKEYLFNLELLANLLYWGFIISISLFILHVSDKFGQGVLLNFILGKYHHPKEEKRIFMFMDLKSSTTYAEILGHIKYSELIQDCFFDLTDVVANNEANIYQYVGDEVVLSWDFEKGHKKNNFINTYFEYMKAIAKRSKYYEKKYGVVPEFKAGISSGYATVAEVGELKKELAYHGDVLNTASRIQGVCNKYNKSLLISEELENNLNLDFGYKKVLIGSIELKGKLQPVNIYSIENV
ncbi:MAG: adenylate/guanylate cyclase domain-containing protein [Ignavibacteriaceae bacterium]|nr:adenylate/guanylate cyclase domain-containing protein [Ignavibacteriaceae bacterium]